MPTPRAWDGRIQVNRNPAGLKLRSMERSLTHDTWADLASVSHLGRPIDLTIRDFPEKQSPYPAITLDAYRQQALDTHNSFRSAHGAPNLVLDSDLNDIAQKYAEKLAQTKVFEHSGNTLNGNAIGENIYEITGLSQPMYAKGK